MSLETQPLLSCPKEIAPSSTRETAKFAACNVSMASLGWHDGCLGALIPYVSLVPQTHIDRNQLQIHYGLTYSQVSMLYIGSFIGYVTAAILNVPLSRKYGIGIVAVLGAVVQGVGSLSILVGLPFSCFVVSYGICGFGLALQDAQVNAHASNLPNASTKIGIMHSIYGLSGVVAPMLATALMRYGLRPNLFYSTNVAWSILSAALLVIGFRLQAEVAPPTAIVSVNEEAHTTSIKSAIESQETSAITYILRQRIAIMIFTFIILYVGCEIGEAGWIVTFLMEERSDGVSAGYASAGFFAGLTSSRVVLLPLNQLLGEHRAVSLYLLVAIACQFFVWFVRDLVSDVVAVHLFGCMMGPQYPIAMSLLTKGLPRPSHVGAIGLLACLGQAGSAIFPFAVGDLAEKYGVSVLQPVLIVVLSAMFLVWCSLPV